MMRRAPTNADACAETNDRGKIRLKMKDSKTPFPTSADISCNLEEATTSLTAPGVEIPRVVVAR